MNQFNILLETVLQDLKICHLFHGISPINGRSLIEQCDFIIKNGFHKSSGVYFTQNIKIALSYRRDLDFEEPQDSDLRGIVEIKTDLKKKCSLDGDIILSMEAGSLDYTKEWDNYFNKNWAVLPISLRKKWVAASYFHTYLANELGDPTFLPEYEKIFGKGSALKSNLYDEAQKIADEVNAITGCKLGDPQTSSGNIVLKDGITPDELSGVYLFEKNNSKFICIKVFLDNGGSIKLGDKFEAIGRQVGNL